MKKQVSTLVLAQAGAQTGELAAVQQLLVALAAPQVRAQLAAQGMEAP